MDEFVVERHWSDGKVRLTLFREHVSDAIISQTNFVSGSTTNVTTFSNVGAIRMQGVELAADKDNVAIKGLEVFGSVTYVDSRILSDSTFVSNITNLPTNVVGKRVPMFRTGAPNSEPPIGRMTNGPSHSRHVTAASSTPRWTTPISSPTSTARSTTTSSPI